MIQDVVKSRTLIQAFTNMLYHHVKKQIGGVQKAIANKCSNVNRHFHFVFKSLVVYLILTADILTLSLHETL